MANVYKIANYYLQNDMKMIYDIISYHYFNDMIWYKRYYIIFLANDMIWYYIKKLMIFPMSAKQSATVSIGSVLKWRARSQRQAVNWAEDVVLVTRAFRLSESESGSADFSEVRVRKFRTLKTLCTRSQHVC
jgi:hypothetical protein